jgi:ankyrin repeat protein
MPAVVKALLEHGADPNVRASRGFPPFDHSAFARTTGNSMPQIRQPGATPFLLAAASLDAGLMRLLIAHGADPKLATDEGTTALMVAAGVGRLEDFTAEESERALDAVRFAVDAGIDVNAANQDGRTALAGAAYLGADRIIEVLAAKGVNLDAKDRYGQTALSIAKGIGPRVPGGDKRFRGADAHKSTADLLIKLGAAPVPDRPYPGPQ